MPFGVDSFWQLGNPVAGFPIKFGLECRARTLRRNRVDVAEQEIGIVKREIAFLEKVRARAAEERT